MEAPSTSGSATRKPSDLELTALFTLAMAVSGRIETEDLDYIHSVFCNTTNRCLAVELLPPLTGHQGKPGLW